VRFTATERVLHWTIAITFFVMLGTGLALYFPVFAQFVDRPSAKEFHLWAAIAMGVAMVLVPLLGNRRAVLDSAREVQYLDRDDVAWLKAGPARQLGRVSPVPQGRFNAGQKLNTALLSGGMTIMYVTGFLLWWGERNTEWRLMGTVPVHDIFTLLLTLLVTGHIYLAAIHPMTRAALRGMTYGDVDREFAEHHHAKWVEEVDRRA
jgi:formate dehydrogenase subunit gamma